MTLAVAGFLFLDRKLAAMGFVLVAVFSGSVRFAALGEEAM